MMRRRPPLITAPRTVVGYHGCSQQAAEKILAEGRFEPSTNAYDWLGEGVYFWEYAPYRALNWAILKCGRTGEQPAVIGATIRLGRCLNLLDTLHSTDLGIAYTEVRSGLGMRRMPRNTATGAHFLDCEVVNTYCRVIAQATMREYQTVRGCYPEGEPVFPDSKILSRTHVQIAVRDPACILRVHLVQFP
jgi:hypothetical protein